MPNLDDDIRAFISVNESATLAEFIDTNLKSFEDHQFDSIETMLRHLKGAFEKAFLAIYPNATNVRSNIAMGQVKKAFYYKETTAEATRNIMFQWFYLLCECHDLKDFFEQHKGIIDHVEKSQSINPKVLIDKMSIKLLKNYDNLTASEKNVLKLSLSYIVDKSEDNIAIYKKYISCSNFWRVVHNIKSDISLIEDQDKKNLEALSKQVLKASKKGIDESLEVVLTRQLELIKERKRHSPEYQVLQGYSYLLHNFEAWSKRKKESEAEKVARINELLAIVFDNSCLTTKTGETIGRNTREIYSLNEYNFSRGSNSNYNTNSMSVSPVSSSSPATVTSSHSGRKMDLIICNENDVELAFCEFKSNKQKNLVQRQASKSLRLNQTIKIGMWKMFVEDPLVYFNWEGQSGRFCHMQESGGIYVSEPKEAIIVPTKLKELTGDFTNTFVALLGWKRHLLSIETKVAIAAIRPDRRDCQYPTTCFTAVNTKKRKL
ncbi:hypothetical protein BD560DRAFT_122660 [Blakeslea trispora]|nr:hypothetical protein BD560DRAFT_122660 [Blakeslea trispora]